MLGTSEEYLGYFYFSVGLARRHLVVKNLPPNAGDIRDTGLIPGSERSTGEEHDNPLKYSCLENPMDRERSLVGYNPKGLKESDMTGVT